MLLGKYVDIMETTWYDMVVPGLETCRNERSTFMQNITNTNKLRGRIVEQGYTLQSFASAVNISRLSLRKKMSGELEFKAGEIVRICTLLSIPRAELCDYFFICFVPKTETTK